jgi:hypothetical protein
MDFHHTSLSLPQDLKRKSKWWHSTYYLGVRSKGRSSKSLGFSGNALDEHEKVRSPAYQSNGPPYLAIFSRIVLSGPTFFDQTNDSWLIASVFGHLHRSPAGPSLGKVPTTAHDGDQNPEKQKRLFCSIGVSEMAATASPNLSCFRHQMTYPPSFLCDPSERQEQLSSIPSKCDSTIHRPLILYDSQR